MRTLSKLFIIVAFATSLLSCRKDDPTPKPIIDPVAVQNGFYFVSEGQFGKNNATLGYYNAEEDTFNPDWWTGINPTVSGGLGDVANDIVAEGDYLLVAVNSSNILEICDRDGRHLGAVEIPACRMIAADGDYAYVTSYADGGYVAKVSLKERKVVGTCATGHEPESLIIIGRKLHVLNSCSYHTDFTGGGNNETASMSVISLDSFSETARNSLGVINAYSSLTLLPDGKSLYINSSGDYNGIAPSSVIYDTESGKVIRKFDFGGTYADVYNGLLYVFDTSFSYTTLEWKTSNSVYDPSDGTLHDFPIDIEEFYTFGAPSGLWINKTNGDIFIADKGNYSSPGFLYRFDKDGNKIARYGTGVCPGHLAWDWR